MNTFIKLIFSSLLFTLVGCSALKIDVDVYKGPLANHEEVQMEQLAVMAVGAKPLLVELRDRLEWPSEQLRLFFTTKCGWYIDGFVKEQEDETNTITCKPELDSRFFGMYTKKKDLSQKGFKNSDARNVNNVLSLYGKKPHSHLLKEITRLRREARDSLDKYGRLATLENHDKWVSQKENNAYYQDDDYKKARAELRNMWNIAIKGLILLKKHRHIVDHDAIYEVASVVAMLTQTRNLGFALNHKTKQFSLLQEILKQYTTAQIEKMGNVWFYKGKWNDDDGGAKKGTYELADKILLKALMAPSTDFSHALLAGDDSLRSKRVDFKTLAGFEAKRKTMIASSIDMFGLVRGPWVKDTEINDFDTSTLNFDFVPSLFGEGRLDDGIETLIREYLLEANIQRKTNQEDDNIESKLTFKKRRLMDALVRFAQKLLFVANNDGLLLDNEDEQRKNYVLVLQAIGNAIVNQADELKQRKAHQDSLKSSASSELSALRSSLIFNPVTFITDLNTILDEKAVKSTDATEKTNIALAKSVIAAKKDALGLIDITSAKKMMKALITSITTGAAVDSNEDKAGKVLKTIKLPYRTYTISDQTDGAKNSNQRQVLDKLIAMLRYDKIEMLRQGNTKRVAQISSALNTAYEQRAGMAYIRPSSAYLRSSMAATGLQSDPNIGWQNTLLPRRYFDVKNDRSKILKNIDKQFWQTINSVTVRGGGNTNYAVAKDDIGNWYVKGYSNDMTGIINSAQRLAMFATGGQLGQNLVRRNQLQNKIGDGTANADEKAEYKKLTTDGDGGLDSPLAKVYAKHQKVYIDETGNDRGALKTKLEGLEAAIIQNWGANAQGEEPAKTAFLTKLATPLTNTVGEYATAIESLTALAKTPLEDVKITQKQAKAILNALNQLGRFGARLVKHIEDANLSFDQSSAVRTAENNQIILIEKLSVIQKSYDQAKSEYDEAVLSLQTLLATSGAPQADIDKAKAQEILQKEALDSQQGLLDTANKNVETANGVVASAKTTLQTTQYNIAMAKKTATQMVNELILTMANKRQQLVKNYQSAVLFISETID